MWKIKTSLDKRRRDARKSFVWAEHDLIEVRNHLEGLTDNEHDWDRDKHDAELVLLPLLLETADLVGLVA